jgi:hypothetical protein
MASKKTKTKNEPWAPAQPYILKGMEQTSRTFDENQPRLQDMSRQAYDAFGRMAPGAFGSTPFVDRAQAAAQAISNGAFLGANPGQATYDRLQRADGAASAGIGGQDQAGGGDLSAAALAGLARGGGANPADRPASAVSQGRYLGGQPSAGLYSNMMSEGYLNGNPYLESVIARTNADVTRDANRLFGARGMGTGISSAFADMLSRNLADNEGQLRYQNYNDASARQLAAAGQSDAAWSGERGRMGAATGQLANDYNARQDRALAAAQALGGQYATQQDRALEAAKASDAAQAGQVQQMLAALGLTGDLRNAEYAGVSPALSLLNSAADLPYVGVGALNGNIRTASNGYGTTTTKQSGGLGGVLGSVVGSAANAFGGGIGTAAAKSVWK